MECRTLRLAALGLVLGCWGCGKSSLFPVAKTDPTTAPMVAQALPPDAKKEPEGPPRQPKPATCVGLAVLREQTASAMKPSAERTEVLEEARRAYQHALKLDPNYLPAYKGLARLYETLEDQDRALETLRRATQFHPRDAEVWYLLGMCHARRKEWPAALESMHKAVELDPENRRYANDYGLCLARAGRYQDAFNMMKQNGGEAQAHYNLARMLEHLGMIEPSKEHVRLALQIKPDMESAQHLLVRLEQGGVQPAHALSTPGATQGVVPASHQMPAEAQR